MGSAKECSSQSKLERICVEIWMRNTVDGLTEFKKFLILRDNVKSQCFLSDWCILDCWLACLPQPFPPKRIITSLSCCKKSNLEQSVKPGVFSLLLHDFLIELIITVLYGLPVSLCDPSPMYSTWTVIWLTS